MAQQILLIGWILAIVCRVVFFREGGEFGAYACTVVFAITTVGLILLSAIRLTERRQGETLSSALILGAMFALVFRFLADDGWMASVALRFFLACAIGLIFVYGRKLLSYRFLRRKV